MSNPHIHQIIADANVTEGLVREVMVSFYADVRSDAVLGPVFISAIGDGDWSPHVERVISFWLSALRISRGYDNKRFMPAHLRHPQITADLLPTWLALFRKSVDAHCEPGQASAFMAVAEAMIENLELSIPKRDA